MTDKIRFLIVNPTTPERRVVAGQHPHRAIKVFRFSMLPSLYVAASVPPYVQPRIIDEDVEPLDVNMGADLVGISCMTVNAPRAYEIADAFRRNGKKVIMGGYHPTFMPEEALRHADAVCVGEAETSVPRMIDDFAAGRLSGIYDGGLADVSRLPRLDRGLLHKTAYLTVNTLQATRGCPHHCSFCSVSRFHQRRHRCRPVADVIDELRQLGKYVLFQDDNLAANPYYARELFAAMIPLRKTWFSQCSIRIADDDELLRLAVRSGCRGLFIGFESLSPDVLRASHKSMNLAKDYSAAVRRLHAAGVAVYGAFVFGFDDDYPDVFRKTLEFLTEANVDVLQATVLTPYPGTELFETLDREGRIFDRDWSHYDAGQVVFEPRNMSAAMLAAGRAWVHAGFHSRRAIARRMLRSTGYLGPQVVLKAGLPLNIGQRHRVSERGLFELARGFNPDHARQRSTIADLRPEYEQV